MRSLTERFMKFCDVSLEDKHRAVLMLQWLVVIGTSYLSLFSGGRISSDARVFALIIALLLSGLVLQRLPRQSFYHRHFDAALVITDAAFIAVGIVLNRDSPWDLFLLFSLCVYIASIAESLIKTLLGCLLLSVGFTFVTHSGGRALWQDSEALLRIPFLFGVSGLYGYLANQVRWQRQRADAAEQAQAVRRRLVSGLAHDIKSPLSVIKGFAEVVGMNLAGVPGQEYSLTAAQRIQENVERILRLVTGFLDASKVEGGEGRPLENPVALNWIIQEVAQQQAVDLRNNNISLELRLDPKLREIMGDAPQLERVFWNLLSNAIKFTPANGSIMITSENTDDQVCVRIRDTGVGIPRDELPLLFSEFRRLKTAAATEGSGLGLYIVKNIVNGHGGTVEVESDLGRGATFILRFPAVGTFTPATVKQAS